MKTVTGKVLNVSLNTPIAYAPPKQGTYPGWQLVYLDASNKAVTIAKHIKGLEYTPQLKTALEGLIPGDEITIQMQQPDGSKYWEIESIAKGMNLPVNTQNEAAPKKEWKSDKTNTYETPEERALRREIDVKRQRLIVRQSSFDQARQLAGVDAKFPAVVKLAKQIEDFVYDGVSFPGDVQPVAEVS